MWIIMVICNVTGPFQIFEDNKYVITSPLRWQSKEWVSVAGVGTGSLWLMLMDENFQHFFQKHSNDESARFFEFFGKGVSACLIAGGVWTAGKMFDNKNAERVGIIGVKSILISGAIVGGIKIVAGRTRPYKNEGPFRWIGINTNDENFSFPSGHTSTAFALASVVSSVYKNRIVSVLAYGVAAGVGWSRINDNQHWTSDVIVGAIIGSSVGRMLVNKVSE